MHTVLLYYFKGVAMYKTLLLIMVTQATVIKYRKLCKQFWLQSQLRQTSSALLISFIPFSWHKYMHIHTLYHVFFLIILGISYITTKGPHPSCLVNFKYAVACFQEINHKIFEYDLPNNVMLNYSTTLFYKRKHCGFYNATE